MNADVQKPIQSLHSFWRHSSGGSIAALPPISIFTIAALCIVMGTSALFAQQADDTNRQSTSEKRLDLLFNKIMRTMPDEVRDRVDSASSRAHDASVQSTVHRDGSDEQHPETVAGGELRMRVRMQELPDDVRVQVERTITEMQQRKEERKAQFRESRKNRP